MATAGRDGGGPATDAADGGRSWRVASAAVVVVFVVSRAAYALAGVRFLYGHAPVYLHFLDPMALRTRLAESLWYDHAQPPGLNLVWGLALKISTGAPDRVLWPLFLAVGLGTSVTLLRLLKRVGLGPRWAVAVVAAWTVSPTAVLLETYVLYTPFEVLGVLLVALLVARWAERGRALDVALVAGVVATLGLTRATFHLVWIVAVFALVVLVRRDRWRPALAWSALPLLLVGGWYLKNALIFDQFGPSSWMGNNLSRITVEQVDDAEREELMHQARLGRGGLGPYALDDAFATFEEMGQRPAGAMEPGRGVMVLDRYTRVGNRFPNLRQRDYLDVSRSRLDDATWVVRHRPKAYLRGVVRSASVTFGSPADFFGYGPDVDHIRPLVTVERWLGGGWAKLPPPGDDDLGRWSAYGRHEWLVLAAYLVALVVVPVRLLRRRPWRPTTAKHRIDADSVPTTSEGPESAARRRSELALVAVTWATVAYLTLVTMTLDFGENNRFRSVTDPAVLVLIAWLLASGWQPGGRAARAVASAGSRRTTRGELP